MMKMVRFFLITGLVLVGVMVLAQAVEPWMPVGVRATVYALEQGANQRLEQVWSHYPELAGWGEVAADWLVTQWRALQQGFDAWRQAALP
jgi:hypothetical protein